jgi:protein-ribulosamine 3-kinase
VTGDPAGVVIGVLARRLGSEIPAQPQRIGGGISQAFRVDAEDGPLLVKLNCAQRLPMFEAEAEGLRCLSEAGALTVPKVRDCARAGEHAYLALEWIDFGPKSVAAERLLGRGLARVHRHLGPAFGWHRDNTIGSTPQLNAESADWPVFWRERRLGFQLELAARNGLPARCRTLGAELLRQIDARLAGHEPQASLLHGDLWGGNWGVSRQGLAYIFDPAVYYGDREADLAMTRLFGGFGPDFYAAYEQEWPLAPGWRERAVLYELYHWLNHFNLFGAGYLPRVSEALERLVAA